jgi:hypothetical protein
MTHVVIGNNAVCDIKWDQAHQTLYASTACENKARLLTLSAMQLTDSEIFLDTDGRPH